MVSEWNMEQRDILGNSGKTVSHVSCANRCYLGAYAHAHIVTKLVFSNAPVGMENCRMPMSHRVMGAMYYCPLVMLTL